MPKGSLPQLSQIKGQKRAAEMLRRLLKARLAGRVYLFLGPEGSGKAEAARALAAAWLCQSPKEEGDCCQHCPACLKLAAASHPDLVILEPLPDKETIGIEQAQDLIKSLRFAPLEAETRFVIIPQAERLSLYAANALLKTLEEPPEETVIILTAASAEALPPTLISRCQTVAFQPLTEELLASELAARFKLSPPQARLASGLLAGRLKAGAGFEPASLSERRDQLLGFLGALSPKDPAGLFDLAEKLAKEEDDLFLAILMAWQRDLLVQASGVSEEKLVNCDRADLLASQAKVADVFDLVARLEAVFEAEAALQARANTRLALEALLLKVSPFGQALAKKAIGAWP